MDIAHNVLGVAAPLEHQRLAVAADVGQQLDAVLVALEHLAVAHPLQGVIVAHIGHHQGMAIVLRRVGKQQLLFECVKRRIKIGIDRKLRGGCGEQLRRSQIRHYSQSPPR